MLINNNSPTSPISPDSLNNPDNIYVYIPMPGLDLCPISLGITYLNTHTYTPYETIPLCECEYYVK